MIFICPSIPLPGLVSGPLISRFGTRTIAVSGSLCSSIAYFVSAFAPNIICLYVSFGIITGKVKREIDLVTLFRTNEIELHDIRKRADALIVLIALLWANLRVKNKT